jgi:hypothetical protein
MAIHAANPETTIADVTNDYIAASKKYHYNELCFTWVTVEFLLNTIIEMQDKIDVMKKKEQ